MTRIAAIHTNFTLALYLELTSIWLVSGTL